MGYDYFDVPVTVNDFTVTTHGLESVLNALPVTENSGVLITFGTNPVDAPVFEPVTVKVGVETTLGLNLSGLFTAVPVKVNCLVVIT